MWEDILKIAELNQDFTSARKYRKQKYWEEATNSLRSLRAKMDVRFQDWYLRVDEALDIVLRRHILFRGHLALQVGFDER